MLSVGFNFVKAQVILIVAFLTACAVTTVMSVGIFLHTIIELIVFHRKLGPVYVMEHVFNPEKAFSEIARVLKPKGMYIFTVPYSRDNEQTEFANALDQFSRKVWRQPKREKAARYDLAILVNPDEKLPPSNPGAIKKFIKAVKTRGIDIELITPSDYIRLAEDLPEVLDFARFH